MTIYLGSDHAGFVLKEKVKKWLGYNYDKYEVVDFGALTLDVQDDYPDFVKPVAEAVAASERDSSRACRGIILGGSGQGEAMVANRIPGVRAAVLYNLNEQIIKLSREHNDANILSLGARFINEEEAFRAIKFWLDTPFSGEERHRRRISKF